MLNISMNLLRDISGKSVIGDGGGGGGGGGGAHFSSYVNPGPASTVHPPKNIRNFKNPKKYLKFRDQKKFPHTVP